MTEKEYAQLRYLQLLKEIEDMEIEIEKKKQKLKVALERLEKIENDEFIAIDKAISQRKVKENFGLNINKKENYERGIY